jgi:hypothetical protein
MHTPQVHKINARLVQVHTFWDDRESDVGICGTPVCWQMCLHVGHVDTGWYMYQPAGTVYL